MKISIKSERGLEFTATNPDESLKQYQADKIGECVHNEIVAFMEECKVALRQLKPGESKVLTSRPVVIEMSRAPEPKAVTGASQ